jgi:hypothetical protein
MARSSAHLISCQHSTARDPRRPASGFRGRESRTHRIAGSLFDWRVNLTAAPQFCVAAATPVPSHRLSPSVPSHLSLAPTNSDATRAWEKPGKVGRGRRRGSSPSRSGGTRQHGRVRVQCRTGGRGTGTGLPRWGARAALPSPARSRGSRHRHLRFTVLRSMELGGPVRCCKAVSGGRSYLSLQFTAVGQVQTLHFSANGAIL